MYTRVPLSVHACICDVTRERCCMVNRIFSEVGITGKMNHSLRVTGATRMYTHGISVKVIQSRTG